MSGDYRANNSANQSPRLFSHLLDLCNYCILRLKNVISFSYLKCSMLKILFSFLYHYIFMEILMPVGNVFLSKNM